MIYSFGGRNFFSFRGDFKVDFRVPPQAQERAIFHSDRHGQRVNSVMGIFGANASGKTHLLKSLGFLQWFIQRSASQAQPDKSLKPLGFSFTDCVEDNTFLFIEFGMQNDYYRYELELDTERVQREALYRKKVSNNYIFERIWNSSEKKYLLKHKKEDFGKIDTLLAQRHNASLISVALLLEHPLALQIDQFFNGFYGIFSQAGRTERHDPHVDNILQTAEFFEEHHDLFKWVNTRLSHFDLGLDNIRIVTGKIINEEGEEEVRNLPRGVHIIDGKKYELPFFLESRGTQALFVLLRYILPVLKNGGLAYIDEFELGLHSHMIPRLIDLFYASKHNEKNAQLIFSTHSDYMIQRLEKYQIVLTEKDDEGVSETFRLDDIGGVRNDENHYSKYHAGAYGGIPRI